MAEAIVRRAYGVEQVREVFGDKTKGKNDICLFPLLESIVDLLRRDIWNYSQNTGITDGRKRPNHDSIYSWFELVVDGKIIDFEINSVDIDEVDDDEMIWSVGGIAFSGPETQVEKIFLFIKKITATYDFDKLMAMATERLKKEKRSHLGVFTRLFYGI